MTRRYYIITILVLSYFCSGYVANPASQICLEKILGSYTAVPDSLLVNLDLPYPDRMNQKITQLNAPASSSVEEDLLLVQNLSGLLSINVDGILYKGFNLGITGNNYYFPSPALVLSDEIFELIGENITLVFDRRTEVLQEQRFFTNEEGFSASFVKWFQSEYGINSQDKKYDPVFAAALEKFGFMIPTIADIIGLLNWSLGSAGVVDSMYCTGMEVSLKINYDSGTTLVRFDDTLGWQAKESEYIQIFDEALSEFKKAVANISDRYTWESFSENQIIDLLKKTFLQHTEGALEIKFSNDINSSDTTVNRLSDNW